MASWFDGKGSGGTPQQARSEAESAMQQLLIGAPHFSADPSAAQVRAALDTIAPLANAAPPPGATGPSVVDAPPMALAQLLSARAFSAMRDRAAPLHAPVFELLQVNSRRMGLPEGEGRPEVAEVAVGEGAAAVGGDERGGHWPALARQRWGALGEVRALARTSATLQVIGSAGALAGVEGGVGGEAAGWQGAAESLLRGSARQREDAERALCRELEALPACGTAASDESGTGAGARAVLDDADFRKVLVQNYELAGVAAHDRFVCGPLGFLLQPYLLPRAVQAAQALNLEANACLQRLQAVAALLAAPNGQLCDARRPAGPLHPDAGRASSPAEYCPEAMRTWAAQRYGAVSDATAELAKLTALVAVELAETGDRFSDGGALLREALTLLQVAPPLFQMEAAGTERGDEALDVLAEAEARIRKQWVPS